jgi:Flp pilus assembly protein TadG
VSARRLTDERGAVAVAGMLLTFALALLLGSAFDVAHAFVVRADLAALADDAALAGAGQLDVEAWREGRLALDPQAARQAAQAELDASPAVSGSVSVDTGSVTVAVHETLQTFALRLVDIPTLEVSASAQATPETP